MDEIHFHGKRLDANKYFELKYFLHEDAKNRVMKEKLNELSVGTPGKSPRTKGWLKQHDKNFKKVSNFSRKDIEER